LRRVGLSKTNSVRRLAEDCTEDQIFTVSLNGANIFIYADPASKIMGTRKTKEQQDKATLAEVLKELAKPRVAMSAREHLPHCSEREDLVVENNVEK
jgi:hypothetical protein